MSFEVPTLSTLRTRIISDVTARIPSLSATLKNSMLNAFSTAFSGAVSGLYKYIAWASRQTFPDTAEQEFLERWGAIKGIGRTTATYASGLVNVSGISGSAIPAGSILVSTLGKRYSIDAALVLSSTSGQVNVTATLAGSDYTISEGSTLVFESSLVGIDSSATVATGSLLATTGTDAETDASYRIRVVSAFANPPRGGSVIDFQNWARAASSALTRVWVFAKVNTPAIPVGTVYVYFMCDTSSAQVAPTESQIQAVQIYLNGVQPAGTIVTVDAPTLTALDITAAIYPNTAAVQDLIKTEVANMLLEKAAPNCTIYLSDIGSAFNRVAGLERFVISVPSDNIAYGGYSMPIPGTYTFTTMS